MKVVIATPLYPPEIGGPATYTAVLERELPKQGVEVEVVKFADARRMPKVIRHLAYYRLLLKRAKSADVIFALDPVSVGLPAYWVAKKLKKPLVVKVVGDYAWEQGVQRFGITASLDAFVRERRAPVAVRVLRAIQTRVARSATRIIVPSEYLRHIVSAWGTVANKAGTARQKIDVIYNAVPTEPPAPLTTVFADMPRPRIVSVGRLVPWKGFEGLIDAVADLREKGIRASLAIIGDGPDREALKGYLRERLGIHGACLAGSLSRSEVLAAIKNADVFALNSSYEGLSHVLIEALALGVPIVATRAGGNSELIQDGVNGLLVPVGDPESLADALSRVLTDKALSAKLSLGAKLSARRFEERSMIAATTKLLTEVVAEQKARRVLMISGDSKLLVAGTEAAKRLALQRGAVERLDVFVWPHTHSFFAILRAVRTHEYDVITAQDPFLRGLLAYVLTRFSKARFNVQVHTDLSAQPYWRHILAHFLLRRADSIRVVTEKVRVQVAQHTTATHITVLPIFTDISRFTQIKHRPQKSKKTIMWIGRFEAEKDPHKALAVLREVRGAGVDAVLVMLGAGSLEHSLAQAAAGLPVEFPGWGDPVQHLAKADVVISTSMHESYGASIIEALAAGVPVVSLDYGIAREAGAIIASKTELGARVIEVLKTKTRGELKLKVLTKEEWVEVWLKSL